MLLYEQWISEQDKEGLLLPAWQRLVDLMAELCDMPASFIVQAGKEHYKVIIANQSVENPYDANMTIKSDVNIFCKKVVEQDAWLYEGNATDRQEWQTNPEVSDDGFNTYLGYPLHWPDGSVFGTICVMDFKKTDLDDRYYKLMAHFREMAERELDLLNKNIQLENIALSDGQTGLLNRKGFYLAAEQLLKSIIRDKENICIWYFDIDNLKPINDNFGHEVGDEAIRKFSAELRHTFRDVDIIARFGGDEFVVMCKEKQRAQEANIITRLTNYLNAENPHPKLSFSYGYVAKTLGDEGMSMATVEDMIKNADSKMYQYKKLKKEQENKR